MNKTIHGLRGFSAFIVVIAHVYGMSVLAGFFPDYGPTFIGSLGVCIFFMISGYLITQSLVKHKHVPTFLKNRIIRIYPVFLALHLVIFSAGPIINYEWLGSVTPTEYILHFLSNLFLLPGIFELPLAQGNAWSLSYSFCFILSLFPIISSLRMQKSPNQKKHSGSPYPHKCYCYISS